VEPTGARWMSETKLAGLSIQSCTQVAIPACETLLGEAVFESKYNLEICRYKQNVLKSLAS